MNKNLSIWTGTALLFSLLAPAAALAWGASGHRITAQVAQQHLSADAAGAVSELSGGRSLALLAAWPDFIRSDSRWDCIQPWHFATVEDGQDIQQALARPADTSGTCRRLFERFELPQNVVTAIDYFADLLRGDRARTRNFENFLAETGAQPYAGSVQLTALALLVHFIGDVHQPLHVGRGGDRGGNSITTNWFGEISKLHSVWDSGLIESEGLSYSEFAAFLEQELAETTVADSTSIDWAGESYAHRAQVYDIWNRTSRENYLPDLSYDYSAAQIGLVKNRLYLGGRRLAHLLNSIFD